MGDTTDDIHVCIMCLRAIMNNKFGFNSVIAHEQAINCIALSLVSIITMTYIGDRATRFTSPEVAKTYLKSAKIQTCKN